MYSHAPLCLVVVFHSMALIAPVMVNQPITTEWSLHPEIVPGLFGTWDTPTVDMLATVHNTPLSQFVSDFKTSGTGNRVSVVRQGRPVYVSTPLSPIFNKSVTKGICLEQQVIPSALM